MDLETGCEQPKIRREAYQLVQTTTSHRGLHSNIANTHHRLVSLFAPPFYFSIIIPISPSLADRLSCRRGPFSLFLFFYTLSLMDRITHLNMLRQFLVSSFFFNLSEDMYLPGLDVWNGEARVRNWFLIRWGWQEGYG